MSFAYPARHILITAFAFFALSAILAGCGLKQIQPPIFPPETVATAQNEPKTENQQAHTRLLVFFPQWANILPFKNPLKRFSDNPAN